MTLQLSEGVALEAEGADSLQATVLTTEANWIATTSHLKPGRRLRMPWKTVHARRDGTHVTACGQACVQWYSLWDLRLDLRSPAMCRDCVIELRRLRATVKVPAE